MARSRFADVTEKSDKRELGRTSVNETPLAIRSGIDLPAGFRETIRERLARKLGYAATLLERGTVRFEDLNGPRGGVDTRCTIKLVLSGHPSLLAAADAAGPRQAFTRAVAKAAASLKHAKGKHDLTAPEAPQRGNSGRSTRASRAAAAPAGAEAGEAARPRKKVRRSVRAAAPRATAALEESNTTPSRKSTRGSSNRGKPSQAKERTAVARSVTPSARASRAGARPGRIG